MFRLAVAATLEEITEVLVLLRRASARSQAGIADLLGAQG